MLNTPLIDWANELHTVGLTGCLTNKYSSASIKKYLSGQTFIAPEIMINNNDVSISNAQQTHVATIQMIERLNVSKFRSKGRLPYNVIDFRQVNLIWGKNGSGKTSILEAIELALTNQIRSLQDVKDKTFQSMQTEVKCRTQDQKSGVSFISGQKPAFYKQLETSWYGTSTGSSKSTINDQFFRFNYFDVNSAYKFVMEESLDPGKKKDPDLLDKFSRLLFDESLISMEKNWTRYAQEFRELLEEKTARISDIEQNIEWYLQSLEDAEKQREQKVDDRQFKDILRRTNCKTTYHGTNHMVSVAQSVENVVECVERIKQSLHEPYLETIGGIIEEKERIIKQYALEDSKIKSLTTEKDSLFDNLTQLNTMKHRAKLQVKTIEKETEDWLNTKEVWKQVQHIVENPDLVIKFRETTDIINGLQALRLFSETLPNFELINHVPLITLEEERKIELKDQYSLMVLELQQANGKEQELTAISAQLDEIRAKLNALGIQYLNHTKDEQCPLCGVIHDSPQLLMNRIEQQNQSISQDLLQQVFTEKEKIKRRISEVQVLLQADELARMINGFLIKNPALLYLIDPQSTSGNGNNLEALFQQWYLNIDTMQMLEEYRSILENMESKGFYEAVIEQADLFARSNSLYMAFFQESNTQTFGTFIEEKLIILTKRLQFEMNAVDQNNESLNQKNVRISQLIEDIQRSESTLSQIELRKNKIEQQYIAIQVILNHFQLSQVTPLAKWLVSFEELRVMTERYQKQFSHQYDDVNYYKQRIADRKEVLEQLRAESERVKSAVGAFEKMKPLSTYTFDVVGRHVAEINRYYKRLVQPSEEIMIIVQGNGIHCKRDQESDVLLPYELSTGQRIALTLSVLFALHFASPQAPRFLMFDEAAAHLDVEHTGRLLDLLEEFAKEGEQILFTTSNSDVASAFRTKFVNYHDEAFIEIAL
ncbi:hypothetical protein T458_12785 [Brevibacillus panacihumi W25]|uniref:Nuclease SbcCD subunit C n=1 Tax=Brevibacillus panacihumi W25 TaxID=1408254 RepID=V6M7S9_9BACL|nr:AAA family ATPase [Brevibacillus panacihumi]EST54569.1 hypothetical protein T458_12785 [Brevibacillus panacihumi W25]